ncbi:hypothetical protein GUI12_00515 [Anaplasmataceae bacterium AB001_6]|nr:hypothetical protein GUI12_00515 [Anaplasmataceae bacterium AB001_6]
MDDMALFIADNHIAEMGMNILGSSVQRVLILSYLKYGPDIILQSNTETSEGLFIDEDPPSKGRIILENYADPLNLISPLNTVLSIVRAIGNSFLYPIFPKLFTDPEYHNIHTSKSLLLFSMRKFVPSCLCQKRLKD